MPRNDDTTDARRAMAEQRSARQSGVGRLDGKVAIITGGASGIGRATALLFAREGAAVVVVDIDEDAGRETAEAISRGSGQSLFVRANVAATEDAQAMVATTEQHFGRVDVLFNNAGILGPHAPIAEYPVEDWDQLIAVNLRGVFLGMKYTIPIMLKGGGGSIISTSSTAGVVGSYNVSAYCASKGGVIQLCRAAALEYGRRGIRVNAICPSSIDTPMFARAYDDEQTREKAIARHPIPRAGLPEEVANLALFLVSDEAAYCTGAVFMVDGGFTAG